MQSLPANLALSPEAPSLALPPPSLPIHTFSSYWPNATPSQRLFLIARLLMDTAEARKIAGVGQSTVEQWRNSVAHPGFREAEQEVHALAIDVTALSRRMARAAAPLILARQIELATVDHKGLSRDLLQVQQRAREMVTRIAGLLQEETVTPGGMTITLKLATRELPLAALDGSKQLHPGDA